jgi:hypothetical protein
VILGNNLENIFKNLLILFSELNIKRTERGIKIYGITKSFNGLCVRACFMMLREFLEHRVETGNQNPLNVPGVRSMELHF